MQEMLQPARHQRECVNVLYVPEAFSHQIAPGILLCLYLCDYHGVMSLSPDIHEGH